MAITLQESLGKIVIITPLEYCAQFFCQRRTWAIPYLNNIPMPSVICLIKIEILEFCVIKLSIDKNLYIFITSMHQ